MVKQSGNKTYVYVFSNEHAWVPAIQLDQDKRHGKKATIVRPIFKNERQMLQCGSRTSRTQEEEIDLSSYANNVLPMQNTDANGNLQDYPDMVSLPFMHEAALLYNLKKRHVSEKPYTRTGDIVIAVNPYQWLNGLYTEKKRIYYSNRLVWDQPENDPRKDMEPHVYEVSALAYRGLVDDGEDQSILVSGESGAGKTETVKICLNHIASVQRGQVPESRHANSDPVVNRIVDSNPLLEAFGNAKTRRNDNSSRFGKYLQLQFDMRSKVSITRSRCALVGSKCEVYLLEKNRVVKHEAAERNFHIFYQLLAAKDSQKAAFWGRLAGTGYESFKYVGSTKTETIEGMHDSDRFQETLRALELVNVTGARLNMLMQAICVVLQLGNLTFAPLASDGDKSQISSPREISDLAELMFVTEQDVSEALTQRTFSTRAESHKVPLNSEAAKDACDALAKEIYQKIFLWLVKTINDATAVDGGGQHQGLIGLLDIFGFESFETNRFSQLCINYANEKLQQKFTQDVFRSVQQEYEEEGIPIKDIWFDDNTQVLDLIEGQVGLLALLNEECVRPKGNDFEFVQKALKANKDSKCLIVNRTDRMSFGIHHYAGKVMYDAEFFVSSNQDTLPTDLQHCVEKCSNEIVSSPRSESIIAPATNKKSAMDAWKGAPRHQVPKRQESNIVAPSVWTKYKNQLNSLMGMLHKTRSRYIRCIKPNSQKQPLLMEHKAVIEQLRCAGVVAGITITRAVFPNSLDNGVVLARFAGMWNSKYRSSSRGSMSLEQKRAEDCRALLKSALMSRQHKRADGEVVDAFVVGKTKTYFRAGALEWLERNRIQDLDVHAVAIQKMARGWLARSNEGSQSQRKQREYEEARRRSEQEQVERQERLTRERARRERRKGELFELKRRMSRLQKQMSESDRATKTKVDELTTIARKGRLSNHELHDAIQERDLGQELKESANLRALQRAKLAENKKLIELLKKENKQYRKDHQKAKIIHDAVQNNNDMLHDSNSALGESFDDLNDHTGRVFEKHEDLSSVLEDAKRENKKLKKKVLKAQDVYMAQAETRLEYQKTLAYVIDMVQSRCTDEGLVEDVIVIALECEGETKSQMAKLEAETEPNLMMSDVSFDASSSSFIY